LNQKSNRHYRETGSNLGFINARLREPDVTVDGCRQMIDRQCERWMGTDMEEYLRPTTLFNREKFDAYYASKEAPVQNKTPQQSWIPDANGDHL
jgi:uncharacterized phage protein (TIGR02220 family)